MSMSTKIDDLPGQELERDFEEAQETPVRRVRFDEPTVAPAPRYDEAIDIYEEQTDQMTLWDKLKREVSEENVVLLILFFVASMPQLVNQLGNIPFLSNYIGGDNTIMSAGLKAALFVIIFVLVKWLVLPRIKV